MVDTKVRAEAIRRILKCLWWMGDCAVGQGEWKMNDEYLIKEWGNIEDEFKIQEPMMQMCEDEMKRKSAWETV